MSWWIRFWSSLSNHLDLIKVDITKFVWSTWPNKVYLINLIYSMLFTQPNLFDFNWSTRSNNSYLPLAYYLLPATSFNFLLASFYFLLATTCYLLLLSTCYLICSTWLHQLNWNNLLCSFLNCFANFIWLTLSIQLNLTNWWAIGLDKLINLI